MKNFMNQTWAVFVLLLVVAVVVFFAWRNSSEVKEKLAKLTASDEPDGEDKSKE